MKWKLFYDAKDYVLVDALAIDDFTMLYVVWPAFSLKIHLVLISSSAIANHDVIGCGYTWVFFYSGKSSLLL